MAARGPSGDTRCIVERRRPGPTLPRREVAIQIDRYSAKSTIRNKREETGPPADGGYVTRGRKSIITDPKTFSRDKWLRGAGGEGEGDGLQLIGLIQRRQEAIIK